MPKKLQPKVARTPTRIHPKRSGHFVVVVDILRSVVSPKRKLLKRQKLKMKPNIRLLLCPPLKTKTKTSTRMKIVKLRLLVLPSLSSCDTSLVVITTQASTHDLEARAKMNGLQIVMLLLT